MEYGLVQTFLLSFAYETKRVGRWECPPRMMWLRRYVWHFCKVALSGFAWLVASLAQMGVQSFLLPCSSELTHENEQFDPRLWIWAPCTLRGEISNKPVLCYLVRNPSVRHSHWDVWSGSQPAGVASLSPSANVRPPEEEPEGVLLSDRTQDVGV